MAAIAAADLLAAWERARSLPAVQRPAVLLSAFEKPEAHSLGTRDEALLAFYADNFGPRLDGLARCLECNTEVELSVPIAELTAAIPAAQPVEPLVLDGQTVHWRLPCDADLAAAADCADASLGALLLLSRCAGQDGLAQDVRAELAGRIAAADPYADITLTLVCPECERQWETSLDIAEFVWAQLQSRAHRLLREVDEIARGYGWPEAQILALSQQRRDSYLELVRHA